MEDKGTTCLKARAVALRTKCPAAKMGLGWSSNLDNVVVFSVTPFWETDPPPRMSSVTCILLGPFGAHNHDRSCLELLYFPADW